MLSGCSGQISAKPQSQGTLNLVQMAASQIVTQRINEDTSSILGNVGVKQDVRSRSFPSRVHNTRRVVRINYGAIMPSVTSHNGALHDSEGSPEPPRNGITTLEYSTEMVRLGLTDASRR